MSRNIISRIRIDFSSENILTYSHILYNLNWKYQRSNRDRYIFDARDFGEIHSARLVLQFFRDKVERFSTEMQKIWKVAGQLRHFDGSNVLRSRKKKGGGGGSL